jgi:hypothetical protein
VRGKNSNKRTRLLELWEPPEGSGDPVGCIASTYTFDTMFFEEECLGRFVAMESDPITDGAVYLIEREEKFASLAGAIVFVDQRNCKGSRSIRWDMLPIRHKPGIFHPKFALLCWTNHVRLLIGSANMTNSGYRYNQELAGVLDYCGTHCDSALVLQGVINLITEILPLSRTPGQHVKRCSKILEWCGSRIGEWELTAEPSADRQRSEVHFLALHPGSASIFDQLKEILDRFRPANTARVVSPFFDEVSGSSEYGPSKELWNVILQRGAARIVYCIPMRARDDELWEAFGPAQALHHTTPGRDSAHTSFERLSEKVDNHDSTINRPIHMKSVYFSQDQWEGHLIGSSNFTSAGMGIAGGHNNIETNLFYIEKKKAGRKARLRSTMPIGESVPYGQIWCSDVRQYELEQMDSDVHLLPGFFSSIIFSTNETGEQELELFFDVSQQCVGYSEPWTISDGLRGSEICDSQMWLRAGKSTKMRVVVSGPPPSGCWIEFANSDIRSWWPVQLRDSGSLPPPEELQNLPLELLVQILSSARPLHHFIRAMKKNQQKKSDFDQNTIVDPHKKVDVSSFILQRTRRVSWALEALRKRLEMPIVSEEQLHWRLKGPIGVHAFMEAIIGETDDLERHFLLSEIALELSRVSPHSFPGCIDTKLITAAINELIRELQQKVIRDIDASSPQMKRYAKKVFRTIGDES